MHGMNLIAMYMYMYTIHRVHVHVHGVIQNYSYQYTQNYLQLMFLMDQTHHQLMLQNVLKFYHEM